MARAEAFGEQCRRNGPPLIAPQAKKAALDPVTEVLKPYERNRIFQNAYVQYLAGALKRVEDDLNRTQQELKRTQDEFTASMRISNQGAGAPTPPCV